MALSAASTNEEPLMQLCDVDVCLGGDRNHVVARTNVTVAEVEVLRAVHGPDSVLNIRPRGNKQVNGADEIERLRRKYRGNVATVEGSRRDVVSTVYSGPRPNLPTTLADIGVDYKGDEKPSRSKKKAADPEVVEEESSLME